MPKLLTYNDSSVITLSCTGQPGWLTKLAVDLTQKRLTDEDLDAAESKASPKLLGFIDSAGHGSVIEHASITLLLRNVSRSFLAQITRHRIGSFTSASQHYTDYRDYPCIVHPEMLESVPCKYIFDELYKEYEHMIDAHNVPPEEARQVLPNAAAVAIIWTVNARSLINFFRQRLCHRNVKEMQIVSRKILAAARLWWPEMFDQIGPPCFKGSCDQGKMSCGKVWRDINAS